jgi:hypothetical protein
VILKAARGLPFVLKVQEISWFLGFLWHFLGIAEVFGAVSFSSAVAADNSRLVSEGLDAFIVILRLERTHMHFVLFDIASHDVLLSFCG